MNESMPDMDIENEMGEAQEDQAQILADQDQTLKGDVTGLDENMGARSETLDELEDEQSDFMRGEVDVKAQMDRAGRHLLGEHQPVDDGDVEDTPGGLEEVIERTDRDLGQHHRGVKQTH